VKGLIALSYGDRRALVNAVRSLWTRPGRLAMWALYALAIIAFTFVKTTPRAHRAVGPPPFFVVAVNDFWVCGFALLFGIVLATGTSRWLGIFSSRAEALLLTRAEVPPLLVTAYLQLRAVAVALVQGFARFAYFIVFGIPSGTTVAALVAQLCFFAAAGAAIASVALPRALAQGAARIAMIAAGSAIAAAAIVPIVLDGLRLLRMPETAALVRWAPAVHPGTILTALAAGDLRAIAIPLAVALVATAAFAFAARDAYPELYTISLANLEWRMRVRSRHTESRDDAAAEPGVRAARSAIRTRLRGALALVWADALMFARNVSPLVTGIVALLALGGGAAFAAVARHDPELAFGVLAGAGPGLAIAVASTTGIRLAPALRMPLFWLGDVSLAARLAAWAAGGFWRDAVLVALVAIGYAAVARDARAPLLVFVGATGLLALTRAVGLAVFALVPNRLDQRGPAVMVRAILSFALVAPPAVAAAVATAVFGVPLVAGVLAGTGVAFAEAAALVLFSAWRLAGRVDSLSLA
jgi:hypothetical protein